MEIGQCLLQLTKKIIVQRTVQFPKESMLRTCHIGNALKLLIFTAKLMALKKILSKLIFLVLFMTRFKKAWNAARIRAMHGWKIVNSRQLLWYFLLSYLKAHFIGGAIPQDLNL